MLNITVRKDSVLAFAIAAMLAAMPALADKPPWASGGGSQGQGNRQESQGGGQHGQGDRQENQGGGPPRQGDRQENQGGGPPRQGNWQENQQGRGQERYARPPNNAGVQPIRERGYFDDHHRTFVHEYYDGQIRAGRCPPGLVKRHNGCMPPGQAKKWRMGRPLPRGVATYNLPPAVIGQIGMPPTGYRYVRVANDILLISVGTRMVVDAIMDLGGR